MTISAVSDFGRLLSATDAAASLGLHVSLLRRLVAEGDLTALRHTNGRLIGIYTKHLEEWRRDHLAVTAARQVARGDGMTVGDASIAHLLPKHLFFPI